MNDNGTVHLRVGAIEDTYNIKMIIFYTKVDASYHGGLCSMLQQRGRKSDPDVDQTGGMGKMDRTLQPCQTCQTGYAVVEYDLLETFLGKSSRLLLLQQREHKKDNCRI